MPTKDRDIRCLPKKTWSREGNAEIIPPTMAVGVLAVAQLLARPRQCLLSRV